MKIQFDVKYRPQIESGEYKVVTRDNDPVRIICWDANTKQPIVGLVYDSDGERETIGTFFDNGCWKLEKGDSIFDLFIITPEPELTEFEQEVRVCVTKNLTTHIKDGNGGEMSSTVFIDDDTAKKMAEELLELVKKVLCKGCAARLEGYINGRDDALKEMDENRVYKHEGPYMPVYWPCHYGGECTDPFHDCINCSRGSVTTAKMGDKK